MAKHADSIFECSDAPLSVALLLLNETSLMEVAATIDPMRAANRFAGRTLFSWTVATPDGKAARLTSGVLFPANVAFREVPRADALIVLAGFNHSFHAPPELTRQLRIMSARFRAIGSVDSGGWVLARAGLLHARQATLHWEDLAEFAEGFPEIDVLPHRYVISGNRFSAGGAVPTLDLMLHLIRIRYGAALSGQVASAFIYDSAPSGQQKQRPVARDIGGDPIVDRAIDLMSAHVEDPLPMRTIAAKLRVSLRQLETRFQARFATGPGQYAIQLRLQTAARLARDSAATFTEISLQCGYSSQAVFSRAFRKNLGQTPGQYRRDHRTFIESKRAGN